MNGGVADPEPELPTTGPPPSVTYMRGVRPRAGHLALVFGQYAAYRGCFIRHRPLLRCAALTSGIVGTVLVAMTHGTILVAGDFPSALLWKIPLTDVVPFSVASWGALSNSGTTFA